MLIECGCKRVATIIEGWPRSDLLNLTTIRRAGNKERKGENKRNGNECFGSHKMRKVKFESSLKKNVPYLWGAELYVVGEGGRDGEDKCTFLAIGFCPHLPPPARNHQPTHPHYNWPTLECNVSTFLPFVLTMESIEQSWWCICLQESLCDNIYCNIVIVNTETKKFLV